jgi:hypothetical protein
MCPRVRVFVVGLVVGGKLGFQSCARFFQRCAVQRLVRGGRNPQRS